MSAQGLPCRVGTQRGQLCRRLSSQLARGSCQECHRATSPMAQSVLPLPPQAGVGDRWGTCSLALWAVQGSASTAPSSQQGREEVGFRPGSLLLISP